jgi:hypothetical protein
MRRASMVDEQGDERRGAQQETPSEREAKKNRATKQDLAQPPEGRDEPPAETVEDGKRDPKSPWLGGGWSAAALERFAADHQRQ